MADKPKPTGDKKALTKADPFPRGVPKPHAVRDWAKSLQTAVAASGLTDLSLGRIPVGRFSPLWPADSLTLLPEPPRGASFGDKMAYRKHEDEIQKRLRHNEQIIAQRNEWYSDGSNDYFTIITDSLIDTQPTLRDLLRDRFDMGDGKYDGVGAFKFLTEWLRRINVRFPQHDEYDEALTKVFKTRLPAGCSESNFLTVARKIVQNVNPFIRSPYEGEALGRMLIEKIMPDYSDAAERLVEELQQNGTLGDIREVEDRCAMIVRRRTSKQPSQLGAAFTATSDLIFAVDCLIGDAERPPRKPGNPYTPRAPGGGGGGRGEIDPKKGIHCKRCPHVTRDGKSVPCLANSSIQFNADHPVLRRLARRDVGLVRLGSARENDAKVRGITAKPLPDNVVPAGKPPNGGAGKGTGDEESGKIGTLQEDEDDQEQDLCDDLIEIGEVAFMADLEEDMSQAVVERSSAPSLEEKKLVPMMIEPLTTPVEAGSVMDLTKRENTLSLESQLVASDRPTTKVPPSVGENNSPIMVKADSVSLNQLAGGTLPGASPLMKTPAVNLDEIAKSQPPRLDREALAKEHGFSTPTKPQYVFSPDTADAAMESLLDGQLLISPDEKAKLVSWIKRRKSDPLDIIDLQRYDREQRAGEHGLGIVSASKNAAMYALRTIVAVFKLAAAMQYSFFSLVMAMAIGISVGFAIGSGSVSALLSSAGKMILKGASIAASSLGASNILLVVGLLASHRMGIIRVAAPAAIPSTAAACGSTFTAESAIISAQFDTLKLDDIVNVNATETIQLTEEEFGRQVMRAEDKIRQFEEKVASDPALKQTVAALEADASASGGDGTITVADTGASIAFLNSTKYFAKNSLVEAPLKVNGVGSQRIQRKYRGLGRVMVKSEGANLEDNGYMKLPFKGAVLNKGCKYNLVPAADMCITHKTSFWLPRGGGDGFLTFENGRKVRVLNQKIAILNTATALEVSATLCQPAYDGETGAMGGVIRGKRTAMTHLSGKIIHNVWHLPYARERHLADVLVDFPSDWTKLIRDCPCDVCLRMNAPRLGPTGSFPRDDEGLVVMDAWKTPIKFIHGGQMLVLGFTHLKSTFRKSYRMLTHHDSLKVIAAAVVFYNDKLRTRNFVITWIHSDRAWKLTQDPEVHKLLKTPPNSIKITTSPPNRPRANPQEGSWKVQAAGTRVLMAQLDIRDPDTDKLDPRYWGYAWDEHEALLQVAPSSSAPYHSPEMKLTGKKGQGAMRRPFGCLAYINDPRYNETNKGTKVTTAAATSLRALHLGYNHEQPCGPMQTLTTSNAYICLCPELGVDGRIWCGTDVSFVPDCFPGLRFNERGGQYVPSPDEVEKRRSGESRAKAEDTLQEVGPDSKIEDDQFDIAEITDIAELFKHGMPGDNANASDEGDKHKDATVEVPDPAPPGSKIRVLYVPDDKYYRALVMHSWQLKSTGAWRHQIRWDATHMEWNEQTLNLGAEKWSLVDDLALEELMPEPGGQNSSAVLQTNNLHPPLPQSLTDDDAPVTNADAEGDTIGARRANRTRLSASAAFAGAATQIEFVQAVSAFHASVDDMLMTATVSALQPEELHALHASIETYIAVPGSEAQFEARKEYASAMLAAAMHGIVIPPLDPLFAPYNADGVVMSAEGVQLDDIFSDQYDCALFAAPPSLDDDRATLLLAAKGTAKTKVKVYSHRDQVRSSRSGEWYDSRIREIAKLRKHGTMTDIRADDPRTLEYLREHKRPVDTMAVGTVKYGEKHEEIELRNRIVIRGDQMDSLSANDKCSPTPRCEGMKAAEANKVLREQDEIQYDYEAAYLQSRQHRLLIARPPVGHRQYDEDGVEILWLVHRAWYGGADSGRLWNDDINLWYCSGDGLDMQRGDVEPCIYHKKLPEGQINHVLYVDDGKCYNDPVESVRKNRDEMKTAMHDRWSIKFGEQNASSTFMLSANVARVTSKKTIMSMKTYIERLADDRLKKKLSEYPASWASNPCGQNLMKEYELAMAKTELLDAVANEEFGSLVGALQYAVNYRPDVAFPVGIGGRCRTFATKGMLNEMTRVAVYLAHTADLGIHLDKEAAHARKLWGRVDSDWYVRRSTTGYHVNLAGGAISHGSSRQHAIAMSSTEAEMMGLAELALEVLYSRSVLTDLGHVFGDESELVTADAGIIKRVNEIEHGPTEVGVDNSGAFDLCHRHTAGKNSRHVERKVYKMRELYHTGVVKLVLVPTADNSADMFTKALDDKTFHKHRATVMNLPE